MMSKELIHLIDAMAREKGISKEELFSALESALLSAVRKKYAGKPNITLAIDRKTGEITVFETKAVVETVADPEAEMSLEEAKKLSPEKSVGETVELPLSIHDLGRIAAQTAKQVLFQRVREAERDVVYAEFKDKAGQVVSGTVMRKEKGVYFINIGKAEAALPVRNTLPGEVLKRGDTVRALIEEIKLSPRGPLIEVTRTSPDFVKSLFKMEVPEINEGLVVIKDVVREPGERTKIAVFSKDKAIDPVGACVGMKGTRVQAIVRELRGERIDIIPWTDDPRVLIAKALSPASIDKVGIDEEMKSAMVVVSDQELSLAIGKRGQNVKLATKLTGWEINILSETEYSKRKMEEAPKQDKT